MATPTHDITIQDSDEAVDFMRRRFQELLQDPEWRAAYERAISAGNEGTEADPLLEQVRAGIHADPVLQRHFSPEFVAKLKQG